ncbi:LysR family transcriptional regulator [Bradyrhizobium sp. LTSPM299]|jgi:DNA-binding transcriptional LysR family regulator|uniref:LysR substrate-binding domain-containing protein n=1 Tax=Bradyrhizobium sp. LTSPM299 TaxID=1619233 RepID=UPI0005C96731|nr:LysR substrate-binding domain-containing protein [Bradyrhizobium sp. LTSPM299]KJC60262.1 LysR family transcriptional regulator [Bradyrhizobium sp. LTSPM299]
MGHVNLDMDVLRTLITAHRLGSFSRAADKIGRSQSAVSQQIRKLEEQVGQPLFVKQGRGLALTNAGEVMLTYAHRILDINDEAVVAVRDQAVEGVVRFGLPADFADVWLPAALSDFKQAYPAIRIEAVVDRNRRLLEQLDNGDLDLVLALDNPARADAQPVATLPVVWIGSASAGPVWGAGEPVPLAVYEAPCFFRQRAIAALDQAGMAWRIAFSSPSLPGLWAAVEAGLGVTLRTAVALPDQLRALPGTAGLPPVPASSLEACLHDAGRTLEPAMLQMRSIIRKTLEDYLAKTQIGQAGIVP